MLKKMHIYIVDQIMFLPILLVNWSLWIVSGYHKVFSIWTGKAWIAPEGWIPWLQNHFSKTIFVGFVEPLFFTLTFLQVVAGTLLTIAILKGEFFDGNSKVFFKAGLFFGALAIACMSFGQNLANDDEDVFQLASYLSTTMISYIFILLYPAVIAKNKTKGIF